MSAALRDWRRWSAILAMAAGVLMALALFSPPGDARHVYLLVAFGLLGAAAGVPFLELERQPALPFNSPRAWLGMIAAVAFAIGMVSYWCGMRQFGGFDHSALIDLAWRLANGQQPYRDFPCPIPIGFVLGAGYSFEWFGIHWRAFVLINALFAMVSFAWSCQLLQYLIPSRGRVLLLALYVQASTTVLVAYWWYNPVTTVMAVLFFLSAAAWVRQPAALFPQASYIISLALLASLKPNIAGVLIAGVTLVLLTSKALRWKLIAYSTTALALFAAWLACHGLQIRDMLAAYLSIAGRGFSLAQFLQDTSIEEKIFALAALGAVLAPAVLAWRSREPGQGRVRALALIAALAGVYGFVTNGEAKLADLALVLTALTLFAATHPLATRYAAFTMALLTGCALGEAVVRQRVKAIGMGTFFEYRLVSVPPPTPFCAGMTTGPRFVAVARAVEQVLAKAPAARVWFGPRMQWAYAAFGRPSPLKQPSWWHPGVSFPAKDEDLYLRDWVDQRFELLVLLGGDTTYLSPAFLSEIRHRYVRVPGPAALTILRLKPAP